MPIARGLMKSIRVDKTSTSLLICPTHRDYNNNGHGITYFIVVTSTLSTTDKPLTGTAQIINSNNEIVETKAMIDLFSIGETNYSYAIVYFNLTNPSNLSYHARFESSNSNFISSNSTAQNYQIQAFLLNIEFTNLSTTIQLAADDSEADHSLINSTAYNLICYVFGSDEALYGTLYVNGTLVTAIYNYDNTLLQTVATEVIPSTQSGPATAINKTATIVIAELGAYIFRATFTPTDVGQAVNIKDYAFDIV